MKKKDDHLFARLDKRFYTILTALILIGFVIALVIMFPASCLSLTTQR